MILKLIFDAIRDLCNPPPPPPPPPPFPTEAEIDAALAALGLKDKNSIVELLDVLKIDSGFHARGLLYKELTAEEDYKGSAEQNQIMIDLVRHRFAEGGIA